jgi:hypothetical protein
MELLGSRNWYLPKWLEWLPKISVEGHAERHEERRQAGSFDFAPGVAGGQ